MLRIKRLSTIGVLLLCSLGFMIWHGSQVKPVHSVGQIKSPMSAPQIAADAPKNGWLELVGIPLEVKYVITNEIAKK